MHSALLVQFRVRRIQPKPCLGSSEPLTRITRLILHTSEPCLGWMNVVRLSSCNSAFARILPGLLNEMHCRCIGMQFCPEERARFTIAESLPSPDGLVGEYECVPFSCVTIRVPLEKGSMRECLCAKAGGLKRSVGPRFEQIFPAHHWPSCSVKRFRRYDLRLTFEFNL